MSQLIRSLYLLLILGFADNTFAETAKPLLLIENQSSYILGKHLDILEDPTGELTLSDIIAPDFNGRFHTSQDDVPNMGNTASYFWFRFQITNPLKTAQPLWFEIYQPQLQRVYFFAQDAKGNWQKKANGALVPAQQRDLHHPALVFKLNIEAGQTQRFYLQVGANSGVRLPAKIWHTEAFAEYYFTNLYVLGISYGMVIMMLIYSLFVFYITRDLIYLYYIGLVFAYLGIQSNLDGIFALYVSNTLLAPFFVEGFMLFIALFTQKFLGTKQHTPILHKLLFVPMIWAVINGILFLSLFLSIPLILATLHQFGLLLSWLLVIIVGCRCYFLGVRPARYFLLAWGAPFLVFAVGILSVINVLPVINLLRDLIHLIPVLVVLLLAFGMADRLSTARREALDAQKKALYEAQTRQKIAEKNAQLQEETVRMVAEMDVTRQMQKRVLPSKHELRQIKTLDIAGFMEPAEEVGGDYYDVLHHGDQTIICIGDVTGHGLSSGVLMLMVQTTIRTLTDSGITGHRDFFNILNKALHESIQRMDADKNMTLLMLSYKKDGTLRFSGQHEDLLVVRANGKLERIDTTDFGFLLGLQLDITRFLRQQEIHLAPGDGIVLYTDGIPEAWHPAKGFYGMERFCDIIQQHWHDNASGIQNAIIHDVYRFADGEGFMDDICLLVFKQQPVNILATV